MRPQLVGFTFLIHSLFIRSDLSCIPRAAPDFLWKIEGVTLIGTEIRSCFWEQ